MGGNVKAGDGPGVRVSPRKLSRWMPSYSWPMVEDFLQLPGSGWPPRRRPCPPKTDRTHAAHRAPAWAGPVCGSGCFGLPLLCGRQSLIKMGKLRPRRANGRRATVVGGGLLARLRAGPPRRRHAGLQGAGFTNRYFAADRRSTALAGSAQGRWTRKLGQSPQAAQPPPSRATPSCTSAIHGSASATPAPTHGPNGRHTIVRDTSRWAPSAWGYPGPKARPDRCRG